MTKQRGTHRKPGKVVRRRVPGSRAQPASPGARCAPGPCSTSPELRGAVPSPAACRASARQTLPRAGAGEQGESGCRGCLGGPRSLSRLQRAGIRFGVIPRASSCRCLCKTALPVLPVFLLLLPNSSLGETWLVVLEEDNRGQV